MLAVPDGARPVLNHRGASLESQTLRALLEMRELILRGAFRPGERLREVPLSARLNVSRTPFRLVLDRLAQEGLLKARPTGGFVASEFTVEDIRDAIEIRGVLEGAAARLAAERPKRREEVTALRACVLASTPSARNPRRHRVFCPLHRPERAVPRPGAAMARSAMLSRSMEHVLTLPFASPNAFFLTETETEEGRETIVLSQAHHRAIANAIVDGEGARAEALAREHSRLARTNLESAAEGAHVSRAFRVHRSSSFRRPSEMTRFKHSRIAGGYGLVAVWGAGVELGSQRSTSSRAAAAMTAAATKWLEGLTPEQRQQATFPIDSEEKVRWNFIPTNMFPRKGVPWKEMAEPQRKLAHELLKAEPEPEGLPHDNVDHGARDDPARDRELRRAEGRERARSRALFLHALRHALAKSVWGLRVEGHHVSLHFTIANNTTVDQHAFVLRNEPGGSSRRRPEEGPANPRPDGRCRARVDGDIRRAQKSTAITTRSRRRRSSRRTTRRSRR